MQLERMQAVCSLSEEQGMYLLNEHTNQEQSPCTSCNRLWQHERFSLCKAAKRNMTYVDKIWGLPLEGGMSEQPAALHVLLPSCSPPGDDLDALHWCAVCRRPWLFCLVI